MSVRIALTVFLIVSFCFATAKLGVHADQCVETLNQGLCTVETEESSIRPSYCKHSNPFVVPFTLSDLDFGGKSQEIPQCFDPGNGMPSNDSNADCQVVRAISAAEFGPFEIKDASLNTTEYVFVRYALFGMKSGALYAVDFNQNLLFPLTSSGIASSGIKQLISAVLQPANSTLGKMEAYVVSVDDNDNLNLYYTDARVDGGQFHVLEKVAKIQPYETIDNIQSVQIGATIWLTVLVSFPGSPKKELRFTRLESGAHVVQNEFKYSITLSRVNVDLSFEIFQHVYNMSTSDTQSFYISDSRSSSGASHAPKRFLLKIQSDKRISIINFVQNDVSLDFTAYQTLDQYLMFSVAFDSPIVITTSAIITEQVRRLNFSKDSSNCASSVPLPKSQSVHLAVTTFNTVTLESKLIIRNLLEFSKFESVEQITSVPVNKRTVECSIQDGFYQEKSQCVKSNQYIVDLPSKAIQTNARFMDMPVNLKDADVNTVVSLQNVCTVVAGGLNMLNPGFNMDSYNSCLDRLATAKCKTDLIVQYATMSNTTSQITNDYLLHNLFITIDTNMVLIYGVQPLFCDPFSSDLLIKEFNNIPLMGKPVTTFISENGQHYFIGVTRKKWEIDSMNKYFEICEKLKQDPENIFLKSYTESCIKQPPSKVDINTFGFYMSSCFPGLHCPSLSTNTILSVNPRYYTLRPNYLLKCPPGSFCLMGVRQPCPEGFVCGEPMMMRPQLCRNTSYNCFAQGLSSPMVPSKGLVSVAPYYPSLPISAGLYVERRGEIDSTIMKCQAGYYCPLARAIDIPTLGNETVDVLKCPANTYCSSPTVTTPTICKCNLTYCSYCPAGSVVENPCPTGYYCTRPDTIKECRNTQYCPEGSSIPLICPAGHYCSTPKNKTLCPAGNFCPVGSVIPISCG